MIDSTTNHRQQSQRPAELTKVVSSTDRNR